MKIFFSSLRSTTRKPGVYWDKWGADYGTDAATSKVANFSKVTWAFQMAYCNARSSLPSKRCRLSSLFC
ncbi:hypothetical protein P886_1860 [Alteromonadaceae bacterium 2753L.S.0a.02]|nr:hypothetical protein P886_1860 [Alteromonadaceae bacterium 2753L.S.0a.02]